MKTWGIELEVPYVTYADTVLIKHYYTKENLSTAINNQWSTFRDESFVNYRPPKKEIPMP